MKYNDVSFDYKAEWILSRLQDADGYESTSSLISALAAFDGITESKIRYSLEKLETAGLVVVDEQPTRDGINDKKLYKANSGSLEDYLGEKDGGLSQPPKANERRVRDLEEQLSQKDERISRLESDLRELESQVEVLQNQFNSRTEDITYLLEHAEIAERHYLALTMLLLDRDIDYEQYLDRAKEQQ